MNDFFRQDQLDWWNDYVAHEVDEMRCEFSETQIRAERDAEDFDLDIPF